MTATDPRPGLAAMLAERLAPAAAALAGACAEDISAAPPPEGRAPARRPGRRTRASSQVEGKSHEWSVMPGQAAGHAPSACRS